MSSPLIVLAMRCAMIVVIVICCDRSWFSQHLDVVETSVPQQYLFLFGYIQVNCRLIPCTLFA